jgi:hypothetical protein
MGSFGSKTDQVYTSVSGEEMNAILADMGFRPELDRDKSGDPMIVFRVEGIRTLVLFYSVENGRAKSVQFASCFKHKASLEKVNAFNSKSRYLKAYLDDEGEVCVLMDLEMQGGVLRALVEETVNIWTGGLIRFRQQMSEAA